ncbi:MAG: SPOR domain-containing protein, partial [Flavobacteriales bacterium]
INTLPNAIFYLKLDDNGDTLVKKTSFDADSRKLLETYLDQAESPIENKKNGLVTFNAFLPNDSIKYPVYASDIKNFYSPIDSMLKTITQMAMLPNDLARALQFAESDESNLIFTQNNNRKPVYNTIVNNDSTTVFYRQTTDNVNNNNITNTSQYATTNTNQNINPNTNNVVQNNTNQNTNQNTTQTTKVDSTQNNTNQNTTQITKVDTTQNNTNQNTTQVTKVDTTQNNTNQNTTQVTKVDTTQNNTNQNTTQVTKVDTTQNNTNQNTTQITKVDTTQNNTNQNTTQITKVDTTQNNTHQNTTNENTDTSGVSLEELGDFSHPDLIYRVQIGAYRFPKNFKYQHLKKLGKQDEQETLEDGITRITFGRFKTLNEAYLFRDQIRAAGILDTFVTAVYKGKRYHLFELRIILKDVVKPK